MKALYWLFAFLILCAAMLSVPLRLFAEYGEKGANLSISLGFLKLHLPKSKENTAGKRLTRRKPMQKMPVEEEKRPGRAENYRKLLPIIGDTLGKLRTRLTVDELTFRYLGAGEDPAMVALQFGAVNAATALLLNPLEAMFRIRKRDVQTAISFTEKKPQVYAALRISISLGVLLWLGICYRRTSRSHEKNMESPDTEV